MRIIDLPQEGDQWLNWRREGVTATDAVILSGRSPYKTVWRLWAEKVGYARPVDLSLNPMVRWGKEMEPVARSAAEDYFDDLLMPALVESTADPIIRASLDGLSSNNEPVELKAPSEKVWNEISSIGTQSKAYKMYWAQVQHQILATGAKRGFLVFWFQGDIKCFEIKRDNDFLDSLLTEIKKFWKQIEERKEPEKDPTKDLYIPKGEDQQKWIANAQIYKSYSDQIKELEEQIQKLKKSQKDVLNELKDLMGEYHFADYCGLMVTRYQVRGRIQYDQLLKDNNIPKDILDNYRDKPADRWRVTVSDSNMPRHIVEPEVIEPLENILEHETFFF